VSVRPRVLDATVVAVVLAALAVAALVDVHGDALTAWDVALPSVCTWRNLTGLPCVTCGLTRGFVATAHGDWARGFAFHPLAPALYVFALTQALLALARIRRLCRSNLRGGHGDAERV
jgi:hypothetical protein